MYKIEMYLIKNARKKISHNWYVVNANKQFAILKLQLKKQMQYRKNINEAIEVTRIYHFPIYI